MIRWPWFFILASFLLCQSASGMFKLLGFSKKETNEKNSPKIVSLLENPDNFPAEDEFKLFMKNVDASLSYGFLCDLIRQKPGMMEKKFGQVINVGGFGIGRALGWAAQLFGINKLMVNGLLDKEKEVTDIFGRVCGKKNQKKPTSIKKILEVELDKKTIGRSFLAGAVGRFTAATVLQCVVDNQKKIPEIIIEEMVVGKKKDPKKLDEEEIFQEEQSDEKGGGASHRALTWAVNLVLNKCVSEGPEWKRFFGKMARKAYTKDEKKASLQMAE